MRHIEVSVQRIRRYLPYIGAEALSAFEKRAVALRRRLAGRIVWNLNSTEKGGGVAELLHAHVGYVRGLGIDARWAVLEGPSEFFALTKRLHNALHGVVGEASRVQPGDRELYDRVMHENLLELAPSIRPGDIVMVHDPQPAGMIPQLRRLGAKTIWRCHVGTDEPTEEIAAAWQFLAPYLECDAFVFSRWRYVPSFIDRGRVQIVTPTIDPTSSKNVELPKESVEAILIHTGIIEGPGHAASPTFIRDDGTPSRVDRLADVIRLGPPPAPTASLVTQVSRWDRLKDPLGVMNGFIQLDDRILARDPHLVLAGPTVHAVADDPEAAEVFGEVWEAWRKLPHPLRARVHLINLPMTDVEENAAIVNALQRHSAIVVQKSLHEGFGLTVAEAMWKWRPVVASAVGGIQDQIVDGVSGLLLKDPTDLTAFSRALALILQDASFAKTLGAHAHARIAERFLGVHSLLHYDELIGGLISAEDQAQPAQPS